MNYVSSHANQYTEQTHTQWHGIIGGTYFLFSFIWISDMLCVRLYKLLLFIALKVFFFFFFEREFQPMASAPEDNSLSTDQDTNQFLV